VKAAPFSSQRKRQLHLAAEIDSEARNIQKPDLRQGLTSSAAAPGANVWNYAAGDRIKVVMAALPEPQTEA
jgi:hypothetical protein